MTDQIKIFSNAVNEASSHIGTYFVAATIFAAGRLLIMQRNAVTDFVDGRDHLILPFGADPMWVSIFAGLTLTVIGIGLFAANGIAGAFRVLELAQIPRSSDGSYWRRLFGLFLVTTYVASFAAISQILLILSTVLSQ